MNSDALHIGTLGKVGSYSKVLVTPELAAWLLQRSPGNRTIAQRKVAQFAEAIRRGEWRVMRSQGMAVDALYRLRNGHHRCLAIAASGVPVEAWIEVGVSDHEMLVADIGTARPVAGELEYQGLLPDLLMRPGDGKRFQSMAGPIYYYAAAGRGNPSPDDMLRIAEAYGQSLRWMLDNWRRPASRAAAAAGFVLAHHENPNAANRLLEGVVTGALLEVGDPAMALRNYLSSLYAGWAKGRDSASVIMAKVCRAAVAEIDHKKLQRLYVNGGPAATISMLTGGSREVRRRCGFSVDLPPQPAQQSLVA